MISSATPGDLRASTTFLALVLRPDRPNAVLDVVPHHGRLLLAPLGGQERNHDESADNAALPAASRTFQADLPPIEPKAETFVILQPNTAFSRFAPVHSADLEGQERVGRAGPSSSE
jgi:hypothetical protein